MVDKSDLLDSAASAAAQSAVKQSENIAQTLGRWCASLVSNSEFGLRWRLDNLSRISARFDRLCQARGISPTQRDAIASKFGILWLEGASMEEADSLQALWAELLASEAVDGQVPLAVISALKMMRPRDAAVFQRACNLALEHKGVFFIPVSLSSVRQTGVFVNRLEDYGLNTRDLVLLESLGLLNASTVHAVELGFGEPGGVGHVDIIAEHPIVPDAQRPNAGGVLFPFLYLRQNAPDILGKMPGLIQLLIISRPDDAALLEGGAVIGVDCGTDEPGHILQRVDVLLDLPQQGALYPA